MARIRDFEDGEVSAEQSRVREAIRSGPRGVVVGPLRVWLHSPDLAERAQSLGAFCRYSTALPQKLSELAILVTGAHWQAGFEWHTHAPLAIAAGVPAEAVEAMRLGRRPDFADPQMQAIYDFSQELVTARRVSDATYAKARAMFGDRALVDLVGILGYYTLIAMTIVAFEVPVPPGSPEPFAPVGGMK